MLLLYSKISISKHEYLLKKYSRLFDLDFNERLLKYYKWQDIQMSLLGRILLEKGLVLCNRKEEVKNIKYNNCGKPFLERSSVEFNISHSSDLVACAIADNYVVGVDVEKIVNINIDEYLPFMTENERKIVNVESEKAAFFDFWTKKEAVLKASGYGFSLNLQSFEVRNNSTEINGQIYYIYHVFLHPDYACNIASTKKIDKAKHVKKICIDVFDL